MNIGSLYLVKKWYWLVFPTKETAAALGTTIFHGLDDDFVQPSHSVRLAAAEADYWSRWFNCEVTYFSPDSYIVFLEQDGKYKRVLTSDGRIGWTWLIESYNECFEEVKTEQ